MKVQFFHTDNVSCSNRTLAMIHLPIVKIWVIHSYVGPNGWHHACPATGAPTTDDDYGTRIRGNFVRMPQWLTGFGGAS
mgnify:FL=1